MSRAQGHIANVLCVLFDQVIARQSDQVSSKDVDMQDGKLATKSIQFCFLRIIFLPLDVTCTDNMKYEKLFRSNTEYLC